MTDEQRFLLEKNLSRFDSYINAVNTKAAFLVSFNTFTLGTLLLKQDVILAPYFMSCFNKTGLFLFISCILSIAFAIAYSFLATSPFLKKGEGSTNGGTLLFFASVASMGRQAYSERITKLSFGEVVLDLIDQTHILAIGASEKFLKIRTATMITVFGTVSTLFLTAVLRFIDWAVK